jgi:hypothetical protein
MRKNFVHVVADEPYKQTASKNITVQCEYNGPRYLLTRVDIKTNKVVFVERTGDDREFLESTFVDNEPDYDFFILDADVHTWEAAYLTNSYSHGEVPDYEETLPTGEKYVYARKDFNGIISESHPIGELKYNAAQNTYVRPPFVSHPISKTEFWESQVSQLANLSKLLEKNISKYSDTQIAEAKAWHKFLSELSTKYNGVDHWKIPFPTTYPDLAV